MLKITIASRKSALAICQAEIVKSLILKFYPDIKINIIGISTKGDLILDKSLSKIGGKGLFVKELELAVLNGIADIAVHSMKDVPIQLASTLCLAAICKREDPRDAFISNKYNKLSEMPNGSIIGTSSLRREAQIRARFPKIIIKPLRGNIQTRINKLHNQQYDAIILAAAGLNRLGLHDKITELIDIEYSLPSAGQGAIGIEILEQNKELKKILLPLNHVESAICVTAERSLLAKLGASCQTPLGSYATLDKSVITLRAMLSTPDGINILHAQSQAAKEDAKIIGKKLADLMFHKNAQEILDVINIL